MSLYKSAIKLMEPSSWYKRPFSSTFGRLPGTLTMGMLHRPDLPWRRWTPERVKKLQKAKEKFEEKFGIKDQGILSLGAPRVWEQLKNIWKRKDLSIPSKLLGIAATPPSELLSTLQRMPHYNPFSDTAVIFDPEERIAKHEMGHMADWARRRLKLLYTLGTKPPVIGESVPVLPALTTLYPEYVANALAEQTEEDPEKKEKLRSMLRRSFGSYMGGVHSAAGGVGNPITGALGARILKFPRSFAAWKSSQAPQVKKQVEKRLKSVREAPTWKRVLGLT